MEENKKCPMCNTVMPIDTLVCPSCNKNQPTPIRNLFSLIWVISTAGIQLIIIFLAGVFLFFLLKSCITGG